VSGAVLDVGITYTHKVGDKSVTVLLDGKLAGHIKAVGFGRYKYFPKGSRTGGKVYDSLAGCKRSLEAA
jgi:hypothetical protein